MIRSLSSVYPYKWPILFQNGGGNSNTGQSARKFFFDREIRDRVVSWLPEQYQEAFQELFSNLSVILRVMSCDKPIKLDKISQLCMDTNLLLVRHFGMYIQTRGVYFVPQLYNCPPVKRWNFIIALKLQENFLQNFNLFA